MRVTGFTLLLILSLAAIWAAEADTTTSPAEAPAGRAARAMIENPDALMLSVGSINNGPLWRRYVAEQCVGLPESVGIVVLSGTWDGEPDPSQPRVLDDGAVGYAHRWEADTMSAVRSIHATGRKACAAVNPGKWRRVCRKEQGVGIDEAQRTLFGFVLGLRDAGWGGIYFDGTPPTGTALNPEDEARCAVFLRALRREWPDALIYLHGSGRDAPSELDRYCDVVLFGEWGEKWLDPKMRPLTFARDLLRAGAWPSFKLASKAAPDVRPTRAEWFDIFAALGAVRAHAADSPRAFERANRIREMGRAH